MVPKCFLTTKREFILLRKKANVKLLIFVAICGEIQDHFVISTFKTEVKICLRFNVYACLD